MKQIEIIKTKDVVETNVVQFGFGFLLLEKKNKELVSTKLNSFHLNKFPKPDSGNGILGHEIIVAL